VAVVVEALLVLLVLLLQLLHLPQQQQLLLVLALELELHGSCPRPLQQLLLLEVLRGVCSCPEG
jgi:hypothetical protein